MQNLHDCQTRIQTDEVRQLQWAHGDVGPVLHNAVNALLVSDTGLEANNSFIDVRHQDAIGEEAGRIGRDGRDFAHAFAELNGGGERGGGGLEARDDFDAFLHWDRIHKVRGHDAGRGAEVRGILSEERYLV